MAFVDGGLRSAVETEPGHDQIVIAPDGRPATDWVGLFKADGSNTRVWWAYTQGATAGSFNVAAPTSGGQYQFCYLLQANVLSGTAVSSAGFAAIACEIC